MRLDLIYFSLLQLSTSQHLQDLSQPLVDLFDIMCSEDPSSRPSASEALDCVQRACVGFVKNSATMNQQKQPYSEWLILLVSSLHYRNGRGRMLRYTLLSHLINSMMIGTSVLCTSGNRLQTFFV